MVPPASVGVQAAATAAAIANLFPRAVNTTPGESTNPLNSSTHPQTILSKSASTRGSTWDRFAGSDLNRHRHFSRQNRLPRACLGAACNLGNAGNAGKSRARSPRAACLPAFQIAEVDVVLRNKRPDAWIQLNLRVMFARTLLQPANAAVWATALHWRTRYGFRSGSIPFADLARRKGRWRLALHPGRRLHRTQSVGLNSTCLLRLLFGSALRRFLRSVSSAPA